LTRWLIQIVAGLPPAIDGVGDYALAIARGLRERQAVETLFVVANPAWRGPEMVEGFPVGLVERKHPAALLLAMRKILAGPAAGPATPVLFHCSLYGYARRALAFWLHSGFVQWKREFPESPWITMFHELYAGGPIWTGPFWLGGFQKRIIRQFARESAASLTSNACYRQYLAQLAGIDESRIVKLPVLSTVGELGELPPLRTRKRQLVVFGKPASRDAVFSRCLPALESACRFLGVERVLEVGPEARARDHGLPAAVESTGTLTAREVSSILGDSLFGFIGLDASILSKSSVFAAYSAHGMTPLVAGRAGGEADGLFANQQYLPVPLESGISGGQMETVSQGALAWYREHGIAAQVSQYAGILRALSEPEALVRAGRARSA
jgi:hypothetical protein